MRRAYGFSWDEVDAMPDVRIRAYLEGIFEENEAAAEQMRSFGGGRSEEPVVYDGSNETDLKVAGLSVVTN